MTTTKDRRPLAPNDRRARSPQDRRPPGGASGTASPGDAVPATGAALWRQRLFEAEAGMTRFVAAQADPTAIRDWMYTRSALFDALPDADGGDPTGWQAVFFRGQALMEQFLVARYGHAAMADWADQGAEVHRLVEPDLGGGARDPILRVGRQAELYGSRFRIEDEGPHEATIEISHCAIWDYRERARARGVTITLQSPCEYCTKATSANIQAQGYEAAYELTDAPDGPGCRWTATAPAAGERGAACAA